MHWKQFFRSIDQYIAFIARWVGYILVMAMALGYVSKFFEWGRQGPFAYLQDSIKVLWLWALTAIVVTLWIWTSRLHRRFVSGFSDNFSGDLRANWDFEGQWRIPEKDTLLVTDSDAGGITKVGAQWENYTFAFKARIVAECLGVIVRAQDLSNYYMFQIRNDRIRPHRRVAVPVVEADTQPEPEKEKPPKGASQIRPIKFIVGWQVFDPPTPLSHHLNDWFDVTVVVRGQSVRLYIDDELAFQRESFLQIPTGKVGFRNWGSEEALVRNVRVTLQP
jgi:hypothetical protein